ncbi:MULTISPECIES: squalene/phytoene synthase family protein [Sphingomonas]|uniref:Phytoene synthase n=1 Tax=Sphingomonas trueperi TaxID=53317 RepID=A0A7X6BCB8_9SPHN|nr:squalene/phytoene synthase family protein [Sphingomonas sp. ABOLD]NJB97383.1 phytoene synthase [Sphingomonas trueperi]
MNASLNMPPEDPERVLILSYAPVTGRPALAALLALDEALAQLLRTTSQPAVGQLRLAWWREALAKLDTAPPPAEPVLRGLAAELLPRGVTGASLVPIVHGWEVLVEEEALDGLALARYGAGRGSLFVAAGTALGAAGDPLAQGGEGWALADLARHLGDGVEADAARSLAAPKLAEALGQRWSRNARALGAMAHRARMDLDLPVDAPLPIGAPKRVARLLWHRLSGR